MNARFLLLAVVLACSSKPPAAPVATAPAPVAAPAPARARVAPRAPAAPAPSPAAVADVGTQTGSAGPARPTQPEYRGDPAKQIDPATVGTGKHFLAVSESPAGSQVGRDVLASGGNAVDAAVALAFALAVTHPTAGNIAGGGFAVVRTGPGKAVALDFREVAPAAATADMYLDKNGNPTDRSLHGDLAVGVPGSVAGLWELHHRLGKKPWKAVVAPAIALASGGFEVTEKLHQAIAALAPLLAKSPASAALWLPGGVARAAGDRVTNPEL